MKTKLIVSGVLGAVLIGVVGFMLARHTPTVISESRSPFDYPREGGIIRIVEYHRQYSIRQIHYWRAEYLLPKRGVWSSFSIAVPEEATPNVEWQTNGSAVVSVNGYPMLLLAQDAWSVINGQSNKTPEHISEGRERPSENAQR